MRVVDVLVVRLADRPEDWRVLLLRRARDTRCPGSWEAVHGRIEPGERAEEAAVREVREETGLTPARLYNVTVQQFYLHTLGEIATGVVFCCVAEAGKNVTLGAEHDAFEWVSVDAAKERFAWPREVEALTHVVRLLRSGDAGALEDVLRVR